MISLPKLRLLAGHLLVISTALPLTAAGRAFECHPFLITILSSKSASQRGMKISAGISPCPGNKALPSLVGARAADTAALCKTSRRLLCLAILSPCQAQLLCHILISRTHCRSPLITSWLIKQLNHSCSPNSATT